MAPGRDLMGNTGPGESVWERLSMAQQKGPGQKSPLGHRPDIQVMQKVK
jgi:hypothetical protein